MIYEFRIKVRKPYRFLIRFKEKWGVKTLKRNKS